MAEYLRLPEKLSFTGDVAENCRVFEMEYDVFVAAAHADKTAKQRANILLNLAGKKAMDKARTFEYKPELKMTMLKW